MSTSSLRSKIKILNRFIEKYSKPENRFYTIKNYRTKSQIFAILCATVTMSLTQNCTSKSIQLGSNVLSSSLPVVVVTEQPPAVSNQTAHEIQFDVRVPEGSSFRAAECQLNHGTIFDCSSKRIHLKDLNDWDHSLLITAKDSHGNISQPARVVFRTDTKSPQVQFLQTPAAKTGSVATTISFSATDLLAGVEKTECAIDDGEFITCASPIKLTKLSLGSHTFKVRAIDRASNVSEVQSKIWTVETSAPIINITSNPDEISNSKNAEFIFSGSVGGISINEFECKLDESEYAPCDEGAQNYSNVTEGVHSFYVRARAKTGTTSDPVKVTWFVDSLPPTIPTISSSVGSQTPFRTASFTFSSTDAVSGISKYECSVDSGAFATCLSPYNLINVADGPRTLRVRAIDRAGNQSTATSFHWTVDTVNPFLLITQKSSVTSDNSVSFNVSDNGVGLQTVQCSLDGINFENCISPFSVMTSEALTLRIRAMDRVGNTSIVSHKVKATPSEDKSDPKPALRVTLREPASRD